MNIITNSSLTSTGAETHSWPECIQVIWANLLYLSQTEDLVFCLVSWYFTHSLLELQSAQDIIHQTSMKKCDPMDDPDEKLLITSTGASAVRQLSSERRHSWIVCHHGTAALRRQQGRRRSVTGAHVQPVQKTGSDLSLRCTHRKAGFL